jgi:hypothetical protein
VLAFGSFVELAGVAKPFFLLPIVVVRATTFEGSQKNLTANSTTGLVESSKNCEGPLK